MIFLASCHAFSATYFDESLRLEKAGRYLESYQAWQNAKMYVSDDIYYQRLGWLNYLMGNYQAGRLDYLNAIKSNPRDSVSAVGIMNCLLAEKRHADARQYGNYLFKMFPGDNSILTIYSKALFDGGFYAEQIKLSENNPDHRPLNATRGWSFFMQGKYSKAVKTFSDLIATCQDKNELASLKDALKTAEKESQYKAGFFYTPIDYNNSLPDKAVKNLALLYSPNKWTHFRLIYGLTEANDNSFNEDSFALGVTKLFGKNSLSFDFMNFSNNDPLTDNGNIFSLQYGRNTSKKVWLFLEIDYSDFAAANALQFSPRVFWKITPKDSLELKTYFIDYSDNNYFSDNGAAAKLAYTRILSDQFSITPYVWKGVKRLAYESDKNYSYNALDKYLSGYGIDFKLNTGKFFDLQLGFAQNRIRPYNRLNNRTYAEQWTLGVIFKQ
ncbi:MAG: hypothetical protein AB1403_03345 [Candidatus Riflebacteria bacterium]